MWLKRNHILHHAEVNNYNEHKIKRLDDEIDIIFQRIPHPRLLSQDGRRFFNTNIEHIKKYKRRGKAKWVNSANNILNRYFNEMTGQSKRFISYFAPD